MSKCLISEAGLNGLNVAKKQKDLPPTQTHPRSMSPCQASQRADGGILVLLSPKPAFRVVFQRLWEKARVTTHPIQVGLNVHLEGENVSFGRSPDRSLNMLISLRTFVKVVVVSPGPPSHVNIICYYQLNILYLFLGYINISHF